MKVDLSDSFINTDSGLEAQQLLYPCVQCGQCTFVCPTFRLKKDEWDGPRGRIFLIKKFIEGQEPSLDLLPPAYKLKDLEGRNVGENLQLHLDRCLTCRSCESSCPYDVKYGRLLDIARELVEKQVPRTFNDRVKRRFVRSIVAYPRRFKPLLRTGQALRKLLPSSLQVRIPPRREQGVWPVRTHKRFMLIWQGCVQPSIAPDINAATARVLDRFGIRLVAASDGCCGSLSQHLAESDEALSHMRKNIDALWPQVEAGAEAIIFTASGCGTHFRDYGLLLKDDDKYADKAMRISELTRDVAEIVEQEWQNRSDYQMPVPVKPKRIAFQASCSLQHGEKLNGLVEKLLKKAGFKLVPVSNKFSCCGSAGAYSVLQRELSESLREDKMQSLLARRPQLIATANIGCLNHLSEVSPVPVSHWIELLDTELENVGF